jgi:hypothetical protein
MDIGATGSVSALKLVAGAPTALAWVGSRGGGSPGLGLAADEAAEATAPTQSRRQSLTGIWQCRQPRSGRTRNSNLWQGHKCGSCFSDFSRGGSRGLGCGCGALGSKFILGSLGNGKRDGGAHDCFSTLSGSMDSRYPQSSSPFLDTPSYCGRRSLAHCLKSVLLLQSNNIECTLCGHTCWPRVGG